MAKKLVDLNPHWLDRPNDTPPRHGLGIVFDCPCGCGNPLGVWFANPVDGLPVPELLKGVRWGRQGETFETLTITPSILRVGGCGWHGFITDGVAKAATEP